jgi:predicted dehydrogenase
MQAIEVRSLNPDVRTSQETRSSKGPGAALALWDFALWPSALGLLLCLLLPARLPGATLAAEPLRLITLDPGHFHAALFQKEMLPGVSEQVHVYAPLGPDLLAHLKRIAQFNSRPESPTRWQLEVHAGPDFLARMLQEPPGNVVVLSGNNRRKMDYILEAVGAGLHVLADKPWAIEAEDLPKLEAALDLASQKGVAACDAMTQRFEVTCLVQKELVNTPDIFGACLPGTADAPAVFMESTHYLLKEVAGVPNLRPAWFFDVRQQGEGLTDAGPHLADLVQWTLLPEQAIDWRRDVRVLRGTRWPVELTADQFTRVTGERAYADFLRDSVRDGRLRYFCNNRVDYILRGIHVRLELKWEFEPGPGAKDGGLAVFRGTKSRIEVRQGREEGFVPEVFVVPNSDAGRPAILRALRTKLATLQAAFPGVEAQEQPDRFRVLIPERLRVGHEAHFALLTRQFLEYVRDPKSIPPREKPNMLAKYCVTTKGVALARTGADTADSGKPKR